MKLSVENYKSIAKKGSINIPGLTIIAGVNSSGKSSFMQPFLILKQTIENNTDADYLVLDGENTNLTECDQLIYTKSKIKAFSIYFSSNKGPSNIKEVQTTFTYHKNNGFLSTSTTINYKDDDQIVMKRNMASDKVDEVIKQIKQKDIIFNKVYNNFKELDSDSSFTLVHSIINDKPFLSLNVSFKRNKGDSVSITSDQGFTFNPNGKIKKFIKNLIHIPGIRSNPKREYKLEFFNKTYQGKFDKYTATIIHKWITSKNKEKLNTLIALISDLGLASNISTTKVNESSVAIKVSRTLNSDIDDNVDLTDVGFGLSQILPVLVALIESKDDNVIYIEQPEIHLHPKAQFKLAKIFCDFVKKGKKIIVETHSSIFIRGLQIEVAEKTLDKKFFSLNWFSQDKNGESLREFSIISSLLFIRINCY